MRSPEGRAIFFLIKNSFRFTNFSQLGDMTPIQYAFIVGAFRYYGTNEWLNDIMETEAFKNVEDNIRTEIMNNLK